MIDLTLLREAPDLVIERIKKKDPHFSVTTLIQKDGEVRRLKAVVELLRHEKNELARKAKTGITQDIRDRSIAISKELKEKEALLIDLEADFYSLYLHCPNIPADDIPVGNKEANKVVKQVGVKPEFSFPVKHHVELGTQLGWLDFEAGTRIASSNFAFYKADAVRLMYSLTMFMLKNNIEHGYAPILPSALVSEQSLTVASNFPKFKDQVYSIGQDGLFLTPTAEVNLANLYRDHIFMVDELPVRMSAWTSCFRREAGTYGATERGLIRIHQFEKVELYTISRPEESNNELDRMVACAESILQKLGLHYRVSLLAGQDCSFASFKTYDIEVWLPGQNTYYEVSSCSNCTDFQARRGLIRYKADAGSKPQLAHTLNGSSLALPRLMVAIMEVYQQADGTIAIPEILKKELSLW